MRLKFIWPRALPRSAKQFRSDKHDDVQELFADDSSFAAGHGAMRLRTLSADVCRLVAAGLSGQGEFTSGLYFRIEALSAGLGRAREPQQRLQAALQRVRD
jgi:hypothetical protein